EFGSPHLGSRNRWGLRNRLRNRFLSGEPNQLVRFVSSRTVRSGRAVRCGACGRGAEGRVLGKGPGGGKIQPAPATPRGAPPDTPRLETRHPGTLGSLTLRWNDSTGAYVNPRCDHSPAVGPQGECAGHVINTKESGPCPIRSPSRSTTSSNAVV